MSLPPWTVCGAWVLAADTLVVTGCTTSGCVRSSVTDAFAYNFKVKESGPIQDQSIICGYKFYDLSLNPGYTSPADVVDPEEANNLSNTTAYFTELNERMKDRVLQIRQPVAIPSDLEALRADLCNRNNKSDVR